MYRKNTAGQFICVQLLLTATGAVATGLTPAARRCIDGTFAAGGGTFTEDGTTGSYKYALAQADTNGNDISIIVTATGAIPVCVNLVTTAADPTDGVHFGLTCLPNTAVTTNASLITSGTGTDQLSVTSGRIDVGKALGTAVTLDSNNVLNVSTKYVGGTLQTARDLGASVLLSTGTGTGQLDFTSGVVKSNSTQWLGGTIPAVNVTGVPLVDLKYTLGAISPAAAGSVGIDWAQVANKGSAVNLSATQIQSVNNLAAGSDSINTIATSGSTLTTGSTVSGTFASTATLDSVYWQIADTAGTLDMYFEFNIGSTGVPTTAVWTGGLTIAVNTLKVFAFNWAGSSWDQVGTLTGTSSLIISEQQYDFTTAHVGTGGNLGLVRLRFQNTGLTTANFYTDQVLCGYTSVLTVAGIATGIWQDTTAGDFTAANSVGKSIINGVSLGTGLTVAAVSGAVGSVTGLTASNLDTTVSSRMATYTQPTGFLAATFPSGTVANTTNITAGTITTVTNLTNAPTAGDLTATMKTSVTTAATAATPTAAAVTGAVGSVTGNVGGNVTGSVGSVVSAVAVTSSIKKNSSSRLTFTMTDATTHNPVTGKTVAGQVSIDGAAFVNTNTATATEISNGDYTLALAAADTNGNSLMYRFTATGCDDLNIFVITQP